MNPNEIDLKENEEWQPVNNATEMEYNTCKICGANNGRAGLLIGNAEKNMPDACMNCHDTRTSGKISIHSNLVRTPEEIEKTFEIIKTIKL